MKNKYNKREAVSIDNNFVAKANKQTEHLRVWGNNVQKKYHK